jgi:very-short-patch-repair endonuclease
MPNPRDKRSKPSLRPDGVDVDPRDGEYFAKRLAPETICDVIRRARERDGTVDCDRVASWVASQQLALITTPQLGVCGLRRNAITGRERHGVLYRVHQGVYLYGQPTFLPGGREFAAVLACGDSALVSHLSGGWVWRITPPYDGDVQITVVGSARRQRRGIEIHRVGHLHPEDWSECNGIPVTSPARTLIDLAAYLTRDELERAIAEAYALRLTHAAENLRAIARSPRRPGVGALRAELSRESGPAWTRREGERRMKLLIRQAGLETPVYNRMVAGWPADVLWPRHKLIVEVDGYQFHGHRLAFERDRKRDAAHVLAGYRVIRITWRQLTEEPMVVVATLAAALAIQ